MRSYGAGQQLNAVAIARAELNRLGVQLTDLTDSNPTHFGLGDERALHAVGRAATRSARYEPTPRGPITAREALAARYGGSPEDYWLTASTSEAYWWILTALLDPGQAIAIPAPGYPLIEPLAALARATTVTYRWHYLHPHGWWADTNAIADLARRRAFGVFALVNPENPTGIYTDAQTRQAVLDAVANAGAALIADEVFNPFALDGQPTTLAGEDQVVVFTLGGLSKSLCAPQMKLAWIRLSGPPPATKPIRELLDQIADTLLPVSSPVALALPDLLDLSDAVIPHTRHRLATNLATARRVLDQAPYRVRRCEGGWSVIVDAPRYVDGDDLPIRLMREAHLAVHPGWFYDLPDDAALVLSLLPHPDQFATSCHNLRAAIDAWAP